MFCVCSSFVSRVVQLFLHIFLLILQWFGILRFSASNCRLRDFFLQFARSVCFFGGLVGFFPVVLFYFLCCFLGESLGNFDCVRVEYLFLSAGSCFCMCLMNIFPNLVLHYFCSVGWNIWFFFSCFSFVLSGLYVSVALTFRSVP